MSLNANVRAEALIEALPYMQKFRGHLFVIKYGGSAMEDEHAIDRLLKDVVFLEAVGINPVVIHGGGKAITERMRQAGQKARFVNGLRCTDKEAIGIVEDVLDNSINPDIANRINLAIRAAMKEPAVMKAAETAGVEPMFDSSPEAFLAVIRNDFKVLEPVVRQTGMVTE